MELIPENILNKMKCEKCKEYITSPPVFVGKNDEIICGNCKPVYHSNKYLIRNKLFEDMAVVLLFPCKYAKRGCTKKLKWGESQEHINTCNYNEDMLSVCESIPIDKCSLQEKDRKPEPTISDVCQENVVVFLCPSVLKDKCSWKGDDVAMLEHFKKEHPELIAIHPYKMSLNHNWIVKEKRKLVNITYENMIMFAHGFLFLIQFKICFVSDSMYCNISMIGNAKLSVHFDYCLALSNYNAMLVGYHVKCSEVLPTIAIFDEKNAIKVELQDEFEIFIKRNKLLCLSCKKEVSEIEKDQIKFCCTNWKFIRNDEPDTKNEFHRCFYYTTGCTYIDIPINMTKHQILLCKYKKSEHCQFCGFYLTNFNMSLIDHFKEAHFSPACTNKINIQNSRITVNERKSAVQKFKGGSILWDWSLRITLKKQRLSNLNFEMNKFAFTVNVLTDFRASEDDNLEFRVSFLNVLSKDEVKCTLIKQKCGNMDFNHWQTIFRVDENSLQFNNLLYSLCLDVKQRN